MLPLGTSAPDFALPNVDGNTVTLANFKDSKALLVMFICNHCPFVVHLREALASFANAYQPQGLGIVAINSNDAENYTDDSPEKMKEEVASAGYTFPYLYDESQAVAQAYTAACTPDFFLFDANGKLAYRGQFDASRPGNGVDITGEDLRAACDSLLAGKTVSEQQSPSIGCNIKWRSGNEPGYFTGISAG